MSGGQRATSSKSHRPDILTPLIDLSVWIQSDFGEGERAASPAALRAAYTTMKPSRLPSGTPGQPRKLLPSLIKMLPTDGIHTEPNRLVGC
jgi:hypothetical protein